jgi:hypothetical protein
MSELQIYYNECCLSNAWAHEDESLCGCGGYGWWGSEVDTWHKCPFHAPDARHPEDDDPEDDPGLE